MFFFTIIKIFISSIGITYIIKKCIDFEPSTDSSKSYDPYKCPICSNNISNTKCYEIECPNYNKPIIFY